MTDTIQKMDEKYVLRYTIIYVSLFFNVYFFLNTVAKRRCDYCRSTDELIVPKTRAKEIYTRMLRYRSGVKKET